MSFYVVSRLLEILAVTFLHRFAAEGGSVTRKHFLNMKTSNRMFPLYYMHSAIFNMFNIGVLPEREG